MSSTYWWSMKITYRVLELWAAQNLTTMGDNPQNKSELLFLYVTHLLNVLYNDQVSWYLKGLLSYDLHNFL